MSRLIDADALMTELMDSDLDHLQRDDWREVIQIVADAPTITFEPHWIPVAEQLPEVGKSVLICDAYSDICIGHRTRSGYYFPDFCEDKIKDVRAWAELPEPYKGVTT